MSFVCFPESSSSDNSFSYETTDEEMDLDQFDETRQINLREKVVKVKGETVVKFVKQESLQKKAGKKVVKPSADLLLATIGSDFEPNPVHTPIENGEPTTSMSTDGNGIDANAMQIPIENDLLAISMATEATNVEPNAVQMPIEGEVAATTTVYIGNEVEPCSMQMDIGNELLQANGMMEGNQIEPTNNPTTVQTFTTGSVYNASLDFSWIVDSNIIGLDNFAPSNVFWPMLANEATDFHQNDNQNVSVPGTENQVQAKVEPALNQLAINYGSNDVIEISDDDSTDQAVGPIKSELKNHSDLEREIIQLVEENRALREVLRASSNRQIDDNVTFEPVANSTLKGYEADSEKENSKP